MHLLGVLLYGIGLVVMVIIWGGWTCAPVGTPELSSPWSCPQSWTAGRSPSSCRTSPSSQWTFYPLLQDFRPPSARPWGLTGRGAREWRGCRRRSGHWGILPFYCVPMLKCAYHDGGQIGLNVGEVEGEFFLEGGHQEEVILGLTDVSHVHG